MEARISSTPPKNLIVKVANVFVWLWEPESPSHHRRTQLSKSQMSSSGYGSQNPRHTTEEPNCQSRKRLRLVMGARILSTPQRNPINYGQILEVANASAWTEMRIVAPSGLAMPPFGTYGTQRLALLKAHTKPLDAFDDYQHSRYTTTPSINQSCPHQKNRS